MDEKTGLAGVDMNMEVTDKRGENEKKQKNVNRFYDIEDNKDDLLKLREEQEIEKMRHLASDRQRSRQAQLEEETENDRLWEAQKRKEKELTVKLNENRQIQKEREIAQRIREESEKEIGINDGAKQVFNRTNFQSTSQRMFYGNKPVLIPPTMTEEEEVDNKVDENQEKPGYSFGFDPLLTNDTDKYF
jgi:hypothetical protein